MGNDTIRHLLRHLLEAFHSRSPRAHAKLKWELRHLLPYCVYRLRGEAGRRDSWLLLNRDYKPLGVVGIHCDLAAGCCTVFDIVEYDRFRDIAIELEVDPETADFWDTRDENCLFIADYDGKPRDYLRRIDQLRSAIAHS